jgi:hypothetical protein
MAYVFDEDSDELLKNQLIQFVIDDELRNYVMSEDVDNLVDSIERFFKKRLDDDIIRQRIHEAYIRGRDEALARSEMAVLIEEQQPKKTRKNRKKN